MCFEFKLIYDTPRIERFIFVFFYILKWKKKINNNNNNKTSSLSFLFTTSKFKTTRKLGDCNKQENKDNNNKNCNDYLRRFSYNLFAIRTKSIHPSIQFLIKVMGTTRQWQESWNNFITAQFWYFGRSWDTILLPPDMKFFDKYPHFFLSMLPSSLERYTKYDLVLFLLTS